MTVEFVLTGPRGDNPLGFLTALGATIVLDDADRNPKLFWDSVTPVIQVEMDTNDRKELIVCIYKQLRKELVRAREDQEPDPVIIPGEKNVKFGFYQYLNYIERASQKYFKIRAWRQRRWLDMASFYGVFQTPRIDSQEKVLANYWVLLEGSGHQNFFETVKNLILNVEKKHLEKALFGPWDMEDEKLSLRLDPIEDRRYALMDINPSRLGSRTMWGANRLAFEAFRLFPAVPAAKRGRSVIGWKVNNGEGLKVRWPLWRYPIGVDVIRSLIGHPLIWQGDWDGLRGLGVHAVIEAWRINVDKYKSMTVGIPVWMEG